MDHNSLEYRKKHVMIGNHGTSYRSGIGESQFVSANKSGMDIDKWKSQFHLKIQQSTDDTLVFDMVGIDASIANALRRILIAEVPTMAIHRCYITNNTSVMQDEVLAHRLGLLPICVDPYLFEYPPQETIETMIDKYEIKTKRFDHIK